MVLLHCSHVVLFLMCSMYKENVNNKGFPNKAVGLLWPTISEGQCRHIVLFLIWDHIYICVCVGLKEMLKVTGYGVASGLKYSIAPLWLFSDVKLACEYYESKYGYIGDY